MSKTKLAFSLLSSLLINFLFLLYSFAQAPSEETLTVTTYYPAPYGVYNEMRAKRMAIGDSYYNGSQYCWPGSGSCATTIDTNADLVVEGNVGIGTTNPGAKLDVEGTVKIVDGTQGAGKVLTSNASGIATWQVGIPTGMIVMFSMSCPSGWTRFSALDGRFPRGAATYGGTGGSDTVSGNTLSTGIPHGDHEFDAAEAGSMGWDSNAAWYDLGNYDHIHSFSVSYLPSYRDIVFCQKD